MQFRLNFTEGSRTKTFDTLTFEAANYQQFSKKNLQQIYQNDV